METFSSSCKSASYVEEMKYSRFCSVISSPLRAGNHGVEHLYACATSFFPTTFTSSLRLTICTPQLFRFSDITPSNCPNTGRIMSFSANGSLYLTHLRITLLLFFHFFGQSHFTRLGLCLYMFISDFVCSTDSPSASPSSAFSYILASKGLWLPLRVSLFRLFHRA